MTDTRIHNRIDGRKLSTDLLKSEIDAITAEAGSWDEYVSADDMVEHAQAVAEQLVESWGFDLNDSDQAGDEMNRAVVSALTFVVLRVGADSITEAAL